MGKHKVDLCSFSIDSLSLSLRISFWNSPDPKTIPLPAGVSEGTPGSRRHLNHHWMNALYQDGSVLRVCAHIRSTLHGLQILRGLLESYLGEMRTAAHNSTTTVPPGGKASNASIAILTVINEIVVDVKNHTENVEIRFER